MKTFDLLRQALSIETAFEVMQHKDVRNCHIKDLTLDECALVTNACTNEEEENRFVEAILTAIKKK